ncbi:hypothetical protein DFH29DRAFT_881738 [Suillus ampliporus]|nr:hypothetical protein DFH29DRAFT_881738 [Suillus ampliporus]
MPDIEKAHGYQNAGMRNTNFIHTSVHLAGHNFCAKPFNLNIEYEDFLSVVNFISNILQELPQWDMVNMQLWDLAGKITGTWQKKGTNVSPLILYLITTFGSISNGNNPVNTFEACLLLNGFLWQGHEDPKVPWNIKDQFLWQGLKIIGEVEGMPPCLLPLSPTIPVGNSTFNEAVGTSPGPGPGDSAALPLHVPVKDNAADDAASEGDTFISGIPTSTQGPVGEDDHSGDGSTHSGPPSSSTLTPPIIPIDHRGDPSKSIHAPLPPETLSGAGSSASSSLITRQKVLPMYTSIYQSLGQYIAHGQALDKYATTLRNKFPAPEYETAITGYLEKLLTQPMEAFNTTKFQTHLNILIS